MRDGPPLQHGPGAGRPNERTHDYGALCDAIKLDLSDSNSDHVISAARLVGDLHEEIQGFLDRGGTYNDVAKVFGRNGVSTTSDAIRVALRRWAKKLPDPSHGGQRKPFSTKGMAASDRGSLMSTRADVPDRSRDSPDLTSLPTKDEEPKSQDFVTAAPKPIGVRDPMIARRLD